MRNAGIALSKVEVDSLFKSSKVVERNGEKIAVLESKKETFHHGVAGFYVYLGYGARDNLR